MRIMDVTDVMVEGRAWEIFAPVYWEPWHRWNYGFLAYELAPKYKQNRKSPQGILPYSTYYSE